jgi:hypothetical protein
MKNNMKKLPTIQDLAKKYHNNEQQVPLQELLKNI